MRNSFDITNDEAKLLHEYRRHDRRAVLVSDDTVDTLREVLAAPLADHGIRDPDNMPLDALAAQYEAEGPADADALVQAPETGTGDGEAVPLDADADGDTDPDLLDALSARDAATLRSKLKKVEMFRERRMSDRADEIEAEACEIAGVDDIEEIDRDELTAE